MEIILLFIVMILPICILGLYIYDMDNEKESLKLLGKLLFSGVLSCFLVLVVSLILMSIIPLFRMDPTQMNIKDLIIYSFICVSLIEEGAKLFFLYKSSYNHKEFDYTFDMIVYSVFVALGFAFFENILYISKGGLLTGISRAFTAIPAHASYGVFMGMFLSKAKCYEVKNPSKSKLYKILSLIVPLTIHGVYDVFAFRDETHLLTIFIMFLFSSTTMFLEKKKKDDMKISMYSIE